MSHVSTLLQAEALGVTLVLLFFLFIVAALIAFVLVAIWLFNDCKQRGENAALWLTLYLVTGIAFTPLVAVIVLVIYLVTRSPEIKYDKQGNLLVPSTPLAPYYGQPQWQPMPAPTPSQGQAPPVPTLLPPLAPVGAPPRSPSGAPPALSKVRCPRCRTIFDYQKQPVGQTHVKCPACGEEGNI